MYAIRENKPHPGTKCVYLAERYSSQMIQMTEFRVIVILKSTHNEPVFHYKV